MRRRRTALQTSLPPWQALQVSWKALHHRYCLDPASSTVAGRECSAAEGVASWEGGHCLMCSEAAIEWAKVGKL